MSLLRILSQGQSTLNANQLGLTTTAKNVSNVNTPGYSRQRVDLVSGLPQTVGNARVGGGVTVGSVSRVSSDFLNKRIETENSELGRFEGLSDMYQQLEMVFSNEAETGLLPGVTRFFNDVRALSAQPDSQPLKSAVRESAQGMTTRFQSVAQNLNQLAADADRRVEGAVSQINELTKEIATLNGRITDVEVQGKGIVANDERDQRDLAVQKLAKIIDVKVTPTENGAISLSSGRLGALVLGTDAQELQAFRSSEGVTPGSVRVFVMDRVNGVRSKDITDNFETGSLGAFLKFRDEVVPGYANKVDQFAYNLASEVNQVHRGAFSADGSTQKDLFSVGDNMIGAASAFKVQDEILKDAGKLATSFVPNAASDNRALLQLVSLEDKAFLDGGQAKLADYMSNLVSQVGTGVREAGDGLQMQKNMVDQLGMFQSQVSGVSLDEEAMNMIKYQKAFDAGAKLIQVADQMYDTVLSLKRF